MTEEERRVIEKFNVIRYETDRKKHRDNIDNLTDFENATIYKWGYKKDIDEALEKRDGKGFARTAYLIIKERTEGSVHRKLFKDVSVFDKVENELFSYYCSQYLKLCQVIK